MALMETITDLECELADAREMIDGSMARLENAYGRLCAATNSFDACSRGKLVEEADGILDEAVRRFRVAKRVMDAAAERFERLADR